MAKVINRKWSVKTRSGLVCVIEDNTNTEIARFAVLFYNAAANLAAEHNAAIDMEIKEYDELLDEYTSMEAELEQTKQFGGRS